MIYDDEYMATCNIYIYIVRIKYRMLIFVAVVRDYTYVLACCYGEKKTLTIIYKSMVSYCIILVLFIICCTKSETSENVFPRPLQFTQSSNHSNILCGIHLLVSLAARCGRCETRYCYRKRVVRPLIN